MGSRKSEKASIGGYVSKNLKRQLQEVARLERRTVSQIVEIFLADGVKRLVMRDLKRKPLQSKTIKNPESE